MNFVHSCIYVDETPFMFGNSQLSKDTLLSQLFTFITLNLVKYLFSRSNSYFYTVETYFNKEIGRKIKDKESSD
uniref:Uncharacterized protein n=1 Tax=Nelumbo nucifera TaxID=4432 RepID=A0A822Y3I1_NELNU|nr:TPA_asm: hypothetical protein HUJ06_027619 [Nelumbo nucifera]